MRYNTSVYINNREISINQPTYFIADIASNHNGDLSMAKELIWLAKESGADCVKFQHFLADKIVSDYGFNVLGKNIGHQAKWNKSVYDIYKECECNREWNEELVLTAKQARIDFMTTPYDMEAVKSLDKYIPAYKIGSGDITWVQFINEIANRDKPILLATGASNIEDVQRAVDVILNRNKDIILMQCNTNYTGSLENFKYINLNVLKTFSVLYPQMLLGLSDHTPGHSTVLGAIALNARVIEKHFTKNNNLTGPDHPFSMNPNSWKEMMKYARELEYALGNGIKKVEGNEEDTVILQRRCIRLNKNIKAGSVIHYEDLECLRPAPKNAVLPYDLDSVIGKTVLNDKLRGQELNLNDIEDF